MIKQVAFDIGNVLFRVDFKSFIKKLEDGGYVPRGNRGEFFDVICGMQDIGLVSMRQALDYFAPGVQFLGMAAPKLDIEEIEVAWLNTLIPVQPILRLLQEFGTNLSMPHAKPIQGKLWEIRPEGNRLFYFAYIEQQFVILHGYRKQSKKAPGGEIAIALRRMQELMDEV